MASAQNSNTPRVGFYLRNRSVADVDLRYPEKGNPGVGGTQFNFVTLPYYLKKHTPDAVESIIYANAPEHLPPELRTEKASNAVEAARGARQDECDAIVYRPTEETHEQNLLGALEELELEAVAWGHNVPLPLPHMDALANCDSVSRFVVVGRERLDQIRDHPLFEKSRCIYNGFDPSPYTPEQLDNEGPPTVAFVGSLTSGKGFHLLAEAWPQIKSQVEQVRLIVIGSARLYDRDAKLGRWGVASESYERQFRPYLSNEEGEVDTSVNFMGTLGTEKIPLLQDADVGVVNPSGRTENCPGSAIEFQAAGTPVVSSAEWGLLDTVRDGETGILVQDQEELAGAIVELLRDYEKRARFGRAGVEFIGEKFAYEKICNQWGTLFRNIKDGMPPEHEPIQKNLFYRDKWLRELMRILKNRIPVLRSVPPLFDLPSRRALLKLVLKGALSPLIKSK